jgi:hypothetical protein
MELHDAVGKDIFIIDDDQYTDRDLKAMSLTELESLKLRINFKISDLSSAIKIKQMEYASGGEGTTTKWYMNHKHALNSNQRVLPFVNNLIKMRKKESRGLSEYFMDEAKAYLKPTDYEVIFRNAKKEMDFILGGN